MTSVATGLILTFVVTSLVMHVVQPELSPVKDAVSFYMNGQLGWILSAGVVAMGLGSLLLNSQLVSAFGQQWRSPSLLLLGAWGVGCIIAGVFPPDPLGHWDRPPSFSGVMHNMAAMILFLSFPLAALLLSRPHQHVAQNIRFPLRFVARLAMIATVAFFGCLAPVFASRPPVALGLVERVVLAVNVAWLLGALGAVRSRQH